MDQQARKSDDRVHRGPDFVTHISQKFRLGAVRSLSLLLGARQGLGFLPLRNIAQHDLYGIFALVAEWNRRKFNFYDGAIETPDLMLENASGVIRFSRL